MSIRYTADEMAVWTGGVWDPGPPPALGGVSHDTRTLRAADLYVAIRGDRFDGHDFLDAAFAKGAAGAVVAAGRGHAGRPDRPLLKVEDPARALRQMAAAYRRKVGARIVGITGSAGKSTVKEMTAQMLAATVSTASTRGNWNNAIGLPLSLLAMDPQTRVGVFECGMSHPGETRQLCAVLQPDWGVVTNVGPVHIESFGTVEAVANEKADLLRSLPADGLAVLNRDSACYEVLRAAAPGRVVTVALSGPADYVCAKRDPATREARVRETATGDDVRVRLPAPGDHNVVNALLACAVARGCGAGWEAIVRALENYQPLPLRWEEQRIRGVRIINDAYNANPLSMRAVLRAFAEERVEGRKWLVLGGMLELGERSAEDHRALGALVAAGTWAGLIAVGPLGKLIGEGAERAGWPRTAAVACASHGEAAQALAERAKPGDAVLLKASRGIRLEEVVNVYKAQAEA